MQTTFLYVIFRAFTLTVLNCR